MPQSIPDGPDDYWTKSTSPDGAHVWVVNAWDPHMSHWIIAGTLFRASPPTEIFAPPTDWSFEQHEWTSNDELRLVGRRYPGTLPGIVLTLDVPARRGTVEIRSHAATGDQSGTHRKVRVPPSDPQPFGALLRWLDAYQAR
jgi:hypothetical protein